MIAGGTDHEIREMALKEETTLREFLAPLFNLPDKSDSTIYVACRRYGGFYEYIAPLLRRDWRLGIGKSLLGVDQTSPMLAKKYEPGKLASAEGKGYYVTEKLDGNRCKARYDDDEGRWVFTSRSGKEMRVNFDMRGFPTYHVYDGEIMSKEQLKSPGQANFNSLSGIVNSKYKEKKGLVYVIFDIIDTISIYEERRDQLNAVDAYRNRHGFDRSSDTQILPVLKYCENKEELEKWLPILLDEITVAKGEGCMVNLGNRVYEQKRTNALLKVKLLETMDMKVMALKEGTGKHAGRVGSMTCFCNASDGKRYECSVGTGLSDEQRDRWTDHPDEILGKIVEVAYFSISQDAKRRGTKEYSLRFPRLKKVREDKEETSEY